MTWTKIPDEWVDRREFSMLPAEDRWHYLCMLTFASRGDYLDGVLSVTQALRVSDHPNPQSALEHLEDVGLIEMSSASPIVRLTEIDVHVPPPSKRTDATGAERQRRRRAHERGDHSLCLAKHCPDAAAVTHRDAVTGGDGGGQSAPVTKPSRVTGDARSEAESRGRAPVESHPPSRHVTRDTGTGRDGTALATQPSAEVGAVTVDEGTGELTSWPTAVPGGGVCSHGAPVGSWCDECGGAAEMRGAA